MSKIIFTFSVMKCNLYTFSDKCYEGIASFLQSMANVCNVGS